MRLSITALLPFGKIWRQIAGPNVFHHVFNILEAQNLLHFAHQFHCATAPQERNEVPLGQLVGLVSLPPFMRLFAIEDLVSEMSLQQKSFFDIRAWLSIRAHPRGFCFLFFDCLLAALPCPCSWLCGTVFFNRGRKK